MRPFFSYYGAKWTGAKHYGPPRSDLVIEPFAGSACYSTRWSPKSVSLYDISPDICTIWDFLINCSSDDIRRIPDRFDTDEDYLSLPIPQRLLCSFWVSKGRASPAGKLSPWYFKYRGETDCRVWGPAVKARIIAQKPCITMWTVDCLSWDQIPVTHAHWHIDPPYNNKAGRCYPHSDVDYISLAEWVKALPGHVDVCENDGADWLPFEPLYKVVSCRGRRDGGRSSEAVWRSAA